MLEIYEGSPVPWTIGGFQLQLHVLLVPKPLNHEAQCMLEARSSSQPQTVESLTLNSFMTEAVIIQKLVHRFAPQINGLISI